MKRRAIRATAVLLLLCLPPTLCSCGRPFFSTDIDRESIETIDDLDASTPFFGVLRLRDGREHVGTIVSVGDVVVFKSSGVGGVGRIEVDPEDVLRIKVYSGTTVIEYLGWGLVSGFIGAGCGALAKIISNLENVVEEDKEVDLDGIGRWSRNGFVIGGALGVLMPLGLEDSTNSFRTVYDRSVYGEHRRRLPAIDWTDWDARTGGEE